MCAVYACPNETHTITTGKFFQLGDYGQIEEVILECISFRIVFSYHNGMRNNDLDEVFGV